MIVLFIGDIFGSPGRRVLKTHLPGLIQKHSSDFVVVNGENAAAGFGITKTVADEIFECGVDVITGGNHIWDKKEIVQHLALEKRIIRPFNTPSLPEHGLETPGAGSGVFVKDGRKLGVINLLGRVFMDACNDPFTLAEREIARLKALHGPGLSVLIDFHAEATSEKNAFGHFIDGKAAAVVGTHTHIQTADEKVLPGGTAFITDAGLTGPYNSVIGVEPKAAIYRFLVNRPSRFEPAEGVAQLNGVVIEFDDTTGKAIRIERIAERES